MAQGDTIVFINSGDQCIDPSYFSEASAFLSENAHYDFIHADVIFGDVHCGDMQMSPRLCHLGRGMPFYHQTMCVRRSVFDEIGVFSTRFRIAMDYEWVCRLTLRRVHPYYFIKRAVIHMDGLGVSATSEQESIYECMKALKMNEILGPLALISLLKRETLYLGRLILNKFGLTSLLVLLKRWRNR